MKNFGGGGKKLTRKNRKYLMKLYRKNRTRKYRGGALISRYSPEELKRQQEKGAETGDVIVQQYLIDIIYKNPNTGEEIVKQSWVTKDEYTQLYATMVLGKQKQVEERMAAGETMMNTIGDMDMNPQLSDTEEFKLDMDLYDAAGKAFGIGEPIYFFDEMSEEQKRSKERGQRRVSYNSKAVDNYGLETSLKEGGGGEKEELPTFESTKTKLKQILEKVKPDNEYYEFSQKLNQELNKIKEEKFNEFVNKIYKNFDKIMSIPIKQKGGAGEGEVLTEEERKRARQEAFGRGEETCLICLDNFIEDRDIVYCGECRTGVTVEPRMGTVVHRRCIERWGNNCPMCRYEPTDADDSPVWFNEEDDSSTLFLRNNFLNLPGIQINAMATQLPLDQMTPEEQADILFIRDQRRRDIVRYDRLVSVRHRILELWGMCLFLFTCHSLGAAWRGQYSSNYLTFLAMFYGSVIAVGLWPEAPGSVMTDQLTEFIVRILTFLDDTGAYLGGGKKTRRKRYKRKRRTKRKMRKKRGGVRGKIGDKVEKAFEMEELDDNGNPTGTTRMDIYKGTITKVFKTGKYDYKILWSDDSFTKEKEDDTLKIFTVPIGDMHQANIPPRTGVSYTGEEDRFKPLHQEHLTPAVKPEGYVPGIQEKPKDDGFVGTSGWAKEQLKKLQSME